MLFKLTTPVAFFIFNRPDLTLRVFERIRDAKPQKLFIIADGARFPEEENKCKEARNIVQKIDWDCEVLTAFSDVNLGCKLRLSSGLDWVFSKVGEAIILEDDCLPDPTFFKFCSELLEYYRNDERVMMISGDNFCLGNQRTHYSYYFSRYINIWGWATWKRAWQCYDVEMKLWNEIKDENWLQDIFLDHRTVEYWSDNFQKTYDGEIDTWDYQWVLACWINSGYSIVPNYNLVSNIGFGNDSSHTKYTKSKSNAMSRKSMPFPINHPPFMIQDTISDRFLQKEFFNLKLLPWIRKQLKKSYLSLTSKKYSCK